MLSITVPVPFRFNPLKHHLGFIRQFISNELNNQSPGCEKELLGKVRLIGSSVMDIYTGNLSVDEILKEVLLRIEIDRIVLTSDFCVISLSDSSRWVINYNDNEERYIHLFPSRSGPHSVRIKANTLKSALLYMIITGKDYVTANDLNSARALAKLPPVRGIAESEAISGMIEILRNQ